MTFYVTSPNFDVLSVIINFLLAKNHPENILKRVIFLFWRRLNAKKIVTRSIININLLPPETIILSYAFKMRQDYLGTSYLDQKYLPSERSETREI